MIGIDTNVLLRAILGDDPDQATSAQDLLLGLTAECPGFVTHVSLAELVWVLGSAYRYGTKDRLKVVRRLVEDPVVEFEDGESVVRALTLAEEGADFADALLHASGEPFGVDEYVTFDQHAAETLGWRLLAGS